MNNNEAVFYLEEDDRHLNVQMETVEQHIIQSIRRCDDITLIASLNRASRSKSVEKILKKYKSEIRTFNLGSEFFKNDDEGDSASITDLIDMTDVILGATHSEKFFVVLIEDAEDLQTTDLEELSSVIQTLNQENNHAGIMMICDPAFVNTIKETNGISALKVSECSLDKVSQQDIQDFIDNRQKDIEPSKKLIFDSSALKTITTHATGSLHDASILLEWCRIYSHYQNTSKLNSNLINQMIGALLKASPQSGANLITDYPPVNFRFEETSNHTSNNENEPAVDIEETSSHASNSEDEPDIDIKEESSTASNTEDELAIGIKGPEVDTLAKLFIQTQNNIPTLKSDGQANEATAVSDADKGVETTDEISPQISKDNVKKSNKSILRPILLLVILSLGLYYIISNTDLLPPPGENGNQAETSPAVTPVSPSQDVQEVFEEIAIPEEDPIVAAGPNDDPKQIGQLQIDSDDTSNETHGEQQETALLEQPLVIEEALNQTKEQTNSQEVNVSETAQTASVRGDLPIEEPQFEALDSDEGSQPEEVPLESITEAGTSEQAIVMLLEIAEQQFNNKQLTTPESNSAFSTYQLILEIDPDNQQVVQGLFRIVDRYKEWIKTDIENENYARARIFLGRALSVDPDDPELKRFWVIVDRHS